MPVSVCRDPVDFYAAHAAAFDAARRRSLVEQQWLDAFLALVPAGGAVLDLGCGMGEPIARHLLGQGRAVTGVDGSDALIALARSRMPAGTWITADMRGLDLGRRFAGIIVWDCLFLQSPAAQRALFGTFAAHAAPGAPLLFNSGTEYGASASVNFGDPLCHASLDTAEYRGLLAENGFAVLRHVVADARCGDRTVWLAQWRPAP
jgi:SAM-dependent methyltransferase